MKRFNGFAKVVITLGSLIYIGVQINRYGDWNTDQLQVFSHIVVWVIALGLVLPNWILEAAKWSILLRETFRFSLMGEILTGHFAGISTPLKAGDYWYRAKGSRERFISVTFANYSLIGALLISGSLCAWINVSRFAWILTALSAIGLVIYFSAHAWKMGKLKDLSAHVPSVEVRLKLLVLSLLRVLTFSLSISLLLDSVITEFTFWDIFTKVCVIYALTAVLPIIQLMDFTVRSGVAIWVFGHGVDPLLIAIVYFLHSLLHSYIPALIGGVRWWRRGMVFVRNK